MKKETCLEKKHIHQVIEGSLLSYTIDKYLFGAQGGHSQAIGNLKTEDHPSGPCKSTLTR